MTDGIKPGLRLIEGEARARVVVGASGDLALVTKDWQPPPPPPLFVEAAVEPRAELSWACVEELEQLGPLELRQLVDLRHRPVPIFIRGRSLVELAADAGICVVEIAGLADVFADESWHAEVYRHRLDRHFAEARAAVAELRARVDAGPALALTDGPAAIYRDRLLYALERLS